MAKKIIHGFSVEYNNESETAKSYLEHMENTLSHEEVKALVESAKHDTLGKIHLEDRHGDYVTLEYISDHDFLIRKRQ